MQCNVGIEVVDAEHKQRDEFREIPTGSTPPPDSGRRPTGGSRDGASRYIAHAYEGGLFFQPGGQVYHDLSNSRVADTNEFPARAATFSAPRAESRYAAHEQDT